MLDNGNPIKHEVYFFRYIPYVEEGPNFANWVTYKSSKTYAIYKGRFEYVNYTLLNENQGYFKTYMFSDLCNNEDSECAGLIIDSDTNFIKGKLSELILDMDDFTEDDRTFTLLNLNANLEIIMHGEPELDKCCPLYKLNDKLDVSSIHDDLDRIPCDTPKEDVIENFLLKRKPVIFQGCLSDWGRPVMDWTMEKFLKLYPNLTWAADVVFHEEIISGLYNI